MASMMELLMGDGDEAPDAAMELVPAQEAQPPTEAPAVVTAPPTRVVDAPRGDEAPDAALSWEPPLLVSLQQAAGEAGKAGQPRIVVFQVASIPPSLGEHAEALRPLLLSPAPPPSEAPTEEAFAAAVPEPDAPNSLLSMLLADGGDDKLRGGNGTGMLRAPTPPPSPPLPPRVRRHDVTDPRLAEHVQQWKAHRLFKARAPLPPPPDSISGAEWSQIAVAVGGPYCALRALSHTLRLSAFSWDALCSAIVAPTPSALLADIHTAVLRVLMACAAPDDDSRPGDDDGDRPSRNSSVSPAQLADPLIQWPALLDTVTWPAYARLYISTSAARGDTPPPRLGALLSRYEPYQLHPRDRAALLAFLCEQLMTCRLVSSELDARRGMLDGSVLEREGASTRRTRRGGSFSDLDSSASGSRLALDCPGIGTNVEVCGVESGLRGSWYAANVIATSPNGTAARVRYIDLLTDDGTRPLEEWVSLEPIGHGTSDADGQDEDLDDELQGGEGDDDALMRHGLPARLRPGFERKYRLRPLPPLLPVPADLEPGTLVEVRLNDGWWQAEIIRADGHRYLCRFPGENDQDRVPRRDMRTALCWRLGNTQSAGAAPADNGIQRAPIFDRMGQWYLADTGAPMPGGLVSVSPPQQSRDLRLNLDSCAVCHRPGQLLCCDGCPLAVHYSCAGETKGSLPDGEYFCPECNAIAPCSRPGGPTPQLDQLVGTSCGSWMYVGADSAGKRHWVLRGSIVVRLDPMVPRRSRGWTDALYPTSVALYHGTQLLTQLMHGLRSSGGELDGALANNLASALSNRAVAPRSDVAGATAASDATMMDVDGGAAAKLAFDHEPLNAAGRTEARLYLNKYRDAPVSGDKVTLTAPSGTSDAPARSRRFAWPTPIAGMKSPAAHGDNTLACIAARCVLLERVLFSLCDGPWRTNGAAQRQEWMEGVTSASEPAQLASKLLQLERSLRSVVFHGTASGAALGWRTCTESARHGVLDDSWPPPPIPLGRAFGESHPAPAQPARLPVEQARRLGRVGGSLLCADATYSSRGRVTRHWASRTVRSAWVAATQGCRTASGLALQLRLLDLQIRWDALARPNARESAADQLAAMGMPAARVPQPEVKHKRFMMNTAATPTAANTVMPSAWSSASAAGTYRTEYLVGPEGNPEGVWMPDTSAPLWAIRCYEEAQRTGIDPTNALAARAVSRRALSVEELLRIGPGGHVEVFWLETGQWYSASLLAIVRGSGMRLQYDVTGDIEDFDAQSMAAMVAADCIAVRAAGRAGGAMPRGAAATGAAAVGRGGGRERGGDRGNKYVQEIDEDALPNPSKAMERVLLEGLVLDWCGKDVSSWRMSKRKIAGMLPDGVLAAAEAALAAGEKMPMRPASVATAEKTLPKRMRLVTTPGAGGGGGRGSDTEDDDTYFQRMAAAGKQEDAGGKQRGGGTSKPARVRAPKPEPLVYSLDKDDRRRALAVLQALRQARGTDGSAMGAKFAHVPTRKESPEYHKVVKYPIDLNSIAAFLQQKETYRTPWDFAYAVELLLTNTQLYHPVGSAMHADADRMRSLFHTVHRMNFGQHVEMPPPMALTLGITGEEPPDLPKEADEEAAVPPDGAGLVNTAAGNEQIGARLRLWWPEDAAWYACRVLRTRKRPDGSLQHRVRYEDDQVEDWVSLHEERWEQLEPPSQDAAGVAADGTPAMPASKSGGKKRGVPAEPEEGDERPPLLGDGHCVIGLPVSIQWHDGLFYDGVVSGYEPYSEQHEVTYTDGSIEMLYLTRGTKQLVRWPRGLPPPLEDACRESLTVMRNVKDRYGVQLALPFERLPSKEELPTYYEVISYPMDFKCIDEKLASGAYKDVDQFVSDVLVMWDNCYVFNGPEHPYTHSSRRLRDAFTRYAGRGGELIGGSGKVTPAPKKSKVKTEGGAAAGGVKRQREEDEPPQQQQQQAAAAAAVGTVPDHGGDGLPAPKKLFVMAPATAAQPAADNGGAAAAAVAVAPPMAFGGLKIKFKFGGGGGGGGAEGGDAAPR